MMPENGETTIVPEHIGWARNHAIFWLVIGLAIFGAAQAMAEFLDLAAEMRTPLFFMIGTIIIVNAIWQAAGFLLIRLEKIVLPRMART
jgi:hypothetical protein